MRTRITRVVMGLMLAALLVPMMGSDGCHRGHGGYGGDYTDVFFGLDVIPSFSDWGFSDSSYYEETYYDEGYYDGGYYDDGYYDDGYYGDDWKSKNPGRGK